ncbi:MAG TPA: hypothetical protein DD458_23250 [Prolixibacteraceae bacterium]|nr:hypothetical protein [Prolixibacteraceae bacterium]HCU61143.1 hypothetical protein [Prolixibacteraceae bacterium]
MMMVRTFKKIADIFLSDIQRSAQYLLAILLLLTFVQCGEKSDNIIPDEPDPSEVVITPGPGMDLYGFIGDNDGTPIKNIVVSDGFSCTATDAKGIYQMKKNANAKFVFFSTPAEYAVNTTSESVKMASFYSEISTTKRHDFTLKKLPAIETSFTLLCIGDPQVTSAEEVTRFRTETMEDIKVLTQSETKPCYGLAMGDMTGDKPAFFDQMKALIGSSAIRVFTTIGNHDKVATSVTTQPRTTDAFSKVYGPVNYSFNRGNVHFVCLDNIIFTDASNYSGGFTSSQVEWLKQDLSYVPKEKMVIVYYHIPIRSTSGISYRTEILSTLQGFAEVHLMCGHTHYTENYTHTSPVAAYEHIHAAACGSWWRSTINGDGAPNGYAVYSINGNTITNWYYKPTNLSKDFQMRLHKGNVSFGGAYGYYNFNQADNTIVANVWNSDSSWKVEAYENGIKVANLTPMPTSMKDAWALGYHIGVLNRNPDNYSPSCKHLYLHTLVNPNANLEIKATDRFGNVYTQNQITTDFTTAISY